MDGEALTPLGAPPDGPARIALDLEGFEVRRPSSRSLARDAAVMLFVVVAAATTLAGILSLATGGEWGGSLLCMLFVSPAVLSSAGLPAMRRLLRSARGAQRVRCTPSELVVEYGGGVQRLALGAVRRVRGAGPGEVVVDVGEGEQMIELAADEDQTRWLVDAIRRAVERARRIPEAPAAPAALEALREREP